MLVFSDTLKLDSRLGPCWKPVFFFIHHNPTNDPMIIQTDNFWSVVIDFVGSDNVGPGRMLRAHNPQVDSYIYIYIPI